MIRLGLYGTGNRTKTLLDSLGGDGFYKVHMTGIGSLPPH